MFRRGCLAGRGATAIFLLVSLIGGGTVLPHAESVDDSACITIAAPHDASAHRIGSARRSTHDDSQHCFVCHTLRSFYSVFDTFEHRDQGRRPERLYTAAFAVAGRIEWTLVHGRAPPV
jgi:hypothetical protein